MDGCTSFTSVGRVLPDNSAQQAVSICHPVFLKHQLRLTQPAWAQNSMVLQGCSSQDTYRFKHKCRA